MKGNISYVDSTSTSVIQELSVGGVAGIISGNVVLDDVESSVSVNIDVKTPTVYAGVLFGQLSQNIESWSNVRASGAYTSIKAITSGSGKSAYTGSLCGRLNSSSVYSFENNISNGVYIANSLNASSGHSVAAATIGVIYANSDITLSNIVYNNYENIEISTIIENTSGSADNKAIGTFGYGYIAGTADVSLYPIEFIQDNGNLYTSAIRASTQSANSRGNAYAGGLLGYLENTNVYLYDLYEITFFKTNAYLDAEVTGTGGAYAGGLFAYEPPYVENSENKKIKLNEDNTSIEVYATQATSSKSQGIDIYAGYYSPLLNINSENNYLNKLDFTVNNGTLIAQRNVGSTAYGNIYAGGLIGSVVGRGSYANQLTDINLSLNNSSVSALGLSFQSPAANVWSNNVSVGGMFGYLYRCGSVNDLITDSSSASYLKGNNNSYLGGSGLHISIKVGANNEEAVVKGIQNSIAGSSDHQNEGHVGGLIGMLRGGYIDDISVVSTNDSLAKPIITFNSTNSPNTASVGGVIGETAINENVIISKAAVDNIHIIGKAFCNKTDDAEKYDVYAGGIIGVLGNNGSAKTFIVNTKITNTKIECIGEERMLAYSGGVSGGVWWSGKTGTYNAEIYNNDIIASSVSNRAFAGGLSGLIQANGGSYTTDNCYIINNYISATSNENTAYSAGISPRKRNGSFYISNIYINSTITGSGKIPLGTGGGYADSFYGTYTTIASESSTLDFTNIFTNPENLNVTSGTDSTTLPEYLNVNKDGVTHTNIDPMYINVGSNVEYSISLSNGNNATIFSAYPIPENAVIRYSGDVSYLLDADGDSLLSGVNYTDGYVKVNSSNPGTVYASLLVPYNGTYYELANQPIVINNGNYSLPNNVQLNNKNNNGTVITNDNDQVAGYSSGTVTIDDETTTYYYAIVNVGQTTINENKNAAQSIQISYSDYKNYKLYTTTATLDEEGDNTNNYLVSLTQDEYDERVETILASKQVKDDFYFFEHLIFSYEGSSVILTPRSDITETVYIIYEFGDGDEHKTAIVEFVPNSLVRVEIIPASYSGVLGIKDDAYVFAPGDTINFEVKEHHKFYYENSSKGYKYEPETTTTIDDVKYIVGTKNDQPIYLTSNDVTIDSNGTTIIGSESSNIVGTEFVIKATSSIDNSITTTATIYVDDDIIFNYTTSGAYFESNRKVVYGTDFNFKVIPVAGYGLSPTKLIITFTVDGEEVKYILQDNTNSDYRNKLLYHPVEDQDGTIETGIDGLSFAYHYSALDGSYSVTIPGGLLTTSVSDIHINVVYSSIYNIVFDKGYEPADGSGRYFVYQVAYGTQLDEGLYEEIIDHIGAYIYGYKLQGYYLVQDGTTLDDYGYSFEEYCHYQDNGIPVKSVYGPMQFYARYTYEVIALLPDIFEINTELFASEVMPIVGDNENLLKIIPVDVNDGFEFTLTHDGSWYGDIPFDVFVITPASRVNIGSDSVTDEVLSRSGVEKVTENVKQVSKNSYFLPPQYINGYIVVRAYAEELTFSGGESESDSSIHDIYGDSIFTATYAITYNKGNPVDITETVSYSNIQTIEGDQVIRGAGFKFLLDDAPFNLPADTSIRLYRFINHELYDVGVLVLNAETSSFYAHDFTNIDTGELLTLPNFTEVYDQKYNLVVTLPNHKGYEDDYSDVEIDLIASFTEQYNFYNYIDGSFAHVSNESYESHANDKFNIHGTIPYGVTYSSNTIKFTVGDEVEGIEDLRHSNKFYVWKVEPTVDRMLTESITFGTLLPTVKTNEAYYYLATDNEVINVSNLTGYTITLLEVENIQDPASGVFVWQTSIS